MYRKHNSVVLENTTCIDFDNAMYICWLDSCRVSQKHKNPMQGTKCSRGRGWFKVHFKTSTLCNVKLQASPVSKCTLFIYLFYLEISNVKSTM